MQSRSIHIRLMSLAMLGLAFATSIQAQTPKNFFFDMGPEIEYYEYREPGFIKEYGGLYGGYMSFAAFMMDQTLYAQAFGSIAGGTLTYDGETYSGQPLTLDTPNVLYNFRGLIGPYFGGENASFMPFSGFCVRLIDDDLKRNYQSGYRRQTTYFYSPVGFEVSTRSMFWSFGARGEFDIFWLGLNNNLDFPTSEYSRRDVNLTQSIFSGYGLQASVFACAQVNRYVYVTIEPFIRYWDVNKSSEKTVYTDIGNLTVYEPDNQTLVYGLRCGFGW